MSERIEIGYPDPMHTNVYRYIDTTKVIIRFDNEFKMSLDAFIKEICKRIDALENPNEELT